MRRGLLLALLLGWAGTAAAQPAATVSCATGMVFEDRNGNGLREADEAGIAGIAVSNGRDIARSAADGGWQLPQREDAPAFVIKPAGYTVATRADGLPGHWRAPGACTPIGLRRQVLPPIRSAGLRVLLFGDPQPDSAADVDYYRRDIIEPIIARSAIPMHGFRLHFQRQVADLGLTMGDVVNDRPALYPLMNAATARLGVPWLHAPGNHDVDAGATGDATSLRGFHAVYGPDTFAWEEPEASFIVLDDVIWQPQGKPGYIGGLREDQFTFLENYLRDLAVDRLLVLSIHIPLFERGERDTFRDADRERLFGLLARFPKVLVVSAHSHTQQHVLHGASSGWHGAQPLHEYNIGATCGAYWSGVKDAAGIPAATMADGTPNGYARLTVQRGGDYTLAWHAARDDSGAQMALHAPGVLRRGAYPAWGVYANVWMGMDDTRVEFRVDGGEWRPMTRVLRPDPALLAENARDDQADALRGYDRSPEAEPSSHLWRGALPTGLAVGEHVVEVRAFDRWRGQTRATTRYRLQEASP